MNKVYEYRCIIAKLVLIPILVLLLLSINYRLWGTSYLKGSLIDEIIINVDRIGCTLTNASAKSNISLETEQIENIMYLILHNIDMFFVNRINALLGIFCTVCLLCAIFFFKLYGKFTLVDLCVRMDN